MIVLRFLPKISKFPRDPRDPRDCVHDQSTLADIKRYIEGRMHEEGEGGREGRKEERKEGAKPKPRQVSRRTQLKVGATRSGEGGTRDGTVLSSFFFFFPSLKWRIHVDHE